VPAARTPFAVDDLIKRYKNAVAAGERHPVLLSGLFILDLLVIHPFEGGNGRVARLLTGAMLSEHGYTVGGYVSLEQMVAESADTYYQALLDSTHGWHEGTADPWLWLGYFTRGSPALTQSSRAGHLPPRRHQDGSARCQRPDHPARSGTVEERGQGSG
jgi:Fic family protein